MSRSVLALVAVFLVWPSALFAAPLSAEEVARIDQLVENALQQSGAPSASVALVRDGQLAFSRAYGKARLDPETSAGVTTRYDIGSVAKQFTATLVLTLVDEGRLSLDQKVSDFFPSASGADQVTLRRLLAQTSGYPNYWVVNYLPVSMRVKIDPQEIVDRWAALPLHFEPGVAWEYSNTNYTLAARIVEIVEGRALAEVLQARIFGPLEMSSAQVEPQGPISGSDAHGYTRTALGPVRPSPRLPEGWAFGAGGLYMTAEDLALWDAAMLNERLLSPAAYRAQQAEAKLADGSGAGYGLGLYVGSVRGRRLLSHDGAALGFLTENRIYPDDKAALVVMVNADYGAAKQTIVDGLEELLFGPVAPVAAPPPAPKPLPETVDPQTTGLATRVLEQLAARQLDEALFTPQAVGYFTPEVRADLADTLLELGRPDGVKLLRRDPWSGYDGSIHEISWRERKLVLIMLRTADGLIEDYTLFAPD